MSKPGDISQWAWDAAGQVWLSFDDIEYCKSNIARAIMTATLAEREGCALIAEPPLAHRVGNVGIWRKRRASIAAAIRKRGEP